MAKVTAICQVCLNRVFQGRSANGKLFWIHFMGKWGDETGHEMHSPKVSEADERANSVLESKA